jgi:hypothetical protein
MNLPALCFASRIDWRDVGKRRIECAAGALKTGHPTMVQADGEQGCKKYRGEK